MQCHTNPENPATGICLNCGRGVCATCMRQSKHGQWACSETCAQDLGRIRAGTLHSIRMNSKMFGGTAWFCLVLGGLTGAACAFYLLTGRTDKAVTQLITSVTLIAMGIWFRRVAQRDF